MKSLLIFIISFLCSSMVYADIEMYYVENIVTVQNGAKFTYSMDFKYKTYNIETKEESEEDVCIACKKPLKLTKAPLEKWFVVISYRIGDKKSTQRKNETLKQLKTAFKITPLKKDSNQGTILSYYQVEKIKEKVKIEENVLSGVKILQSGDTYSQKVIIPPNDNFVLLKAMAVNQKGEYYKYSDIKVTASCGKLKLKDSSRFSFTFFDEEQQCSLYARVGKYMDVIEIIKLNKDGSMPSSFNILYKKNNVDQINIDYYTFKKRGVVLTKDKEDHLLKWNFSSKDLRMQVIKDGVLLYPKRKKDQYKVELLDIKKGTKDTLDILIKK